MTYTPETIPFDVPPSAFVRALGERLDPGVPRTVLDVGMGEGRHSFYMSGLGHDVVGVSNDPTEVRQASDRAHRLGIATCNFVVADARQLQLPQPFDIVLANDILHLMAKRDSRQVITGLQAHTKQGGINAVSGYVVQPGTANERNSQRMLAPGELEQSYKDSGWQVIDYAEEYHPITHTKDGKQHVHSQARLLAQRPW